MLTDRFGRNITYLRISVTDRCNFRCVYCMPPEGVQIQKHAEILSYEEILAVVRIAAAQGIRKVRLTGGEPLVRRDLVFLIRELGKIPGINDISLTTNGFLLESLAAPLAEAGLRRINVSLDTLNADLFRKITRGGEIDHVWRGILAAEKAGLTPIKLNAVAIRGVNEGELVNLASQTREHPWDVRFIELMPVGNSSAWGGDFPRDGNRFMPVSEVQERLSTLDLQPVDDGSPDDGPAQMYRVPGGRGKIGFISPISEHFCERCNRLRLTADGSLRPCLLIDEEVPVRELLRAGEDITPALLRAIELKPEAHELAEEIAPIKRRMVDIGG